MPEQQSHRGLHEDILPPPPLHRSRRQRRQRGQPSQTTPVDELGGDQFGIMMGAIHGVGAQVQDVGSHVQHVETHVETGFQTVGAELAGISERLTALETQGRQPPAPAGFAAFASTSQQPPSVRQYFQPSPPPFGVIPPVRRSDGASSSSFQEPAGPSDRVPRPPVSRSRGGARILHGWR